MLARTNGRVSEEISKQGGVCQKVTLEANGKKDLMHEAPEGHCLGV